MHCLWMRWDLGSHALSIYGRVCTASSQISPKTVRNYCNVSLFERSIHCSYHHHAISSSAVNSEKRQETKIDPALNTKKRQTTWRALKATLRLKGSRRDHPLEPNPICVETTDVEEVWFAGCHGDVGGGSVPDDTVHSLGDVSLAWMIKEIMLSQCGILFNQGKLVRQGFRISAFREDPCVTSNQNALQPIYDMLYTPGPQVFWWILEILPTKYSYQDSVGRWCTSWRWFSHPYVFIFSW